MAERLTDEQLVELVQTKSPADLTTSEVEQLRTRVRESDELRMHLVDHLHMESYLHAALGEYRVSIDDLAAKVETAKRERQRRLTVYGGGMGLLVVLLLVGGVWYVRSQRDVDADEIVAVADDPESPDENAPPDRDPAAAAIDPSGREVDPDEPPKPWAVVLEAEDYVHSNLETDTTAYGKGIGVLVDGREKDGFAEFVVNPPRAGLYQLELRYASDNARPLVLSVNGEVVRDDAAAQDTGEWGPAGQRAFVEARLELPADRTVIRLEGPTFPHLDKVAVASVYDAEGPAVAAANELPTLQLRSAEAVPAAAVAATEGPWEEWLAPDREPFPFEEVSLDDQRPMPFDGLTGDVLEKWFEKPQSGSYRIQDRQHGGGMTARFEGTGKLKPNWPADAALRLALHDFDQFEMRFWDGDEGLLLRVDPHKTPGLWCGYSARRENGKLDTTRLTLLATDSARHQRSHWGPVELRWQNGTLVMTRGNVRLLTVPLEKPPREVEWNGKATVRGIALYRSTPVPAESPTDRRLLAHVDRPAELAWGRREQSEEGVYALVPFEPGGPPTWTVTPTETSKLTGHADGTVELEVASAQQPVEVAATIPGDGLSEYVFRLRGAEPGTGLFLGDATGRPLERLAFLADGRLRGTAFKLQTDDGRQVAMHVDAYHQPWPVAGDEQWFRLVPGAGHVKLLVSGDGIHWGLVSALRSSDPTARINTVGLYCHSTKEPRSIALDLIDVRELSSVVAHARPDLRPLVPVASLVEDVRAFDRWYLAVLRSLPADVELSDWRRACAVETLRARPWHQFAEQLLETIRLEAIAGPGDTAARVALLEEVALLSDRFPADVGARFAAGYEDLGRQLLAEGAEEPLQSAVTACVEAPLWTSARVDAAIEMPELSRDVLVANAFSRNWEAVEAAARTRRFYLTHAHPDRVREMRTRTAKQVQAWAEIVARRRLRLPASPRLPTFDRQWRHPLVAESTKEAYNVMAEFESALAAGAFEDACRIVSATDEQGIVGMLPDSKDRSLLVSLPRAVRSAMQDHPQLKETMRESFGPVAEIRVQRAVNAGDEEAVRAATVRYLGTSAAAAAHAWLGDRDLAAGRVTQAVRQYQSAIETATSSLRNSVEARLQLAEAMLGREIDGVDRNRVDLGGVSLSKEEFAGLTTRVRPTRRDGDLLPKPIETATPDLPPTALVAEVRGRFDGEVGQHAERGRPTDVDSTGRQLATVVAGNLLIVGNRFQITAYDLGSGERRWSTGLGGEQGFANEWPLTKFQPLVAGDRIYARRLTKEGAEIACLAVGDGKLLWRTDPTIEYVSDPVSVGGRLVAVGAEGPVDGQLHLDLVTLSPGGGEVVARANVLRQRDVWKGMPPCRVTAAGTSVLGGVGASLFLADPLGDVHWIRRLPWMPVNVNERWRREQVTPPLVDGDRFFVAWPSSYRVACYEVSGGRQVWSRSVPGLRSLVGLSDARSRSLVLRTDDGFEAIAPIDATEHWRIDAPYAYFDAVLTPSHLVFASAAPIKRPRGTWEQPQIDWYDLASGERRGAPLVDVAHKNPLVGPLVVTTKGLWTFVGPHVRDPHRDLVHVRPVDGEATPFAPGTAPRAWQPGFDAKLEPFLQTIAPGWTLVSPETYRNGSAGHKPRAGNEPDVLSTHAGPGHSAVFTKTVSLPADRPQHLACRVWNDGGEGWWLRVHVDGAVVAEQEVADKWETIRVDLSDYAGRTVRLAVVHEPNESGSGVHGYWKSIALVDGPAPE